MRNLFIPVCLLAVIAFSCSKDDDTPVISKYLQRIETTDANRSSSSVLTYTGKQLNTITDSNATVIKDSVAYKNGVVAARYVNRNGSTDPWVTYEYGSGGKVVKVRFSQHENYPYTQNYDSLVYNNSGNVSKAYTVSVINNAYNLVGIKEYNWDANGNITEMKAGSCTIGGTLVYGHKYTYTYDTKTSSFSRLAPSLFWQYGYGYGNAGKNNMTRQEYFLAQDNGSFLSREVTTYQYTYDNDGDIVIAKIKVEKEGDQQVKEQTATYSYGRW